MMSIHLLRPFWCFALLPLMGCFALFLRKGPHLNLWRDVCDAHLLPFLIHDSLKTERKKSILCLFISMCCIILALSGPAWKKYPVPAYQTIHPVVVLASLSEGMQEPDLSPSRWGVAQFKLHDLFSLDEKAQYGLIAFTREPFVVSPLTDDPVIIDLQLQELNPQMMPVGGNRLDLALKKAQQLVVQAGFEGGQILVLTGETPDAQAIREASRLYSAGFHISIMPIIAQSINPLFSKFAQAGGGEVLPLSSNAQTLKKWIHVGQNNQFLLNKNSRIPIYRDEGKWFLIPALLFLLPVFRRGFLERIVS